MRKIVFFTLAVIIICAVTSPASAALPTLPSGKENPLPILYPELNGKVAPPLVTEGLRATYYATTKNGESLIQTDVVALDGSLAATSTTLYIQGPLGYMRPLSVSSFGSIVPAGCGDFWCDPGILKKAKERSDNDVVIVRAPLEVNGEVYQAIRFEIKREGTRYIMTYDENTGLLIHHRYDILSADGTSTDTGILQIRNTREVEIPWEGGTVPGWIRAGKKVTYQGQTLYQIPGSADVPLPLTLTVEFASVLKESSVLKSTVQDQSTTWPSSTTVSGVYQLMGFWLPEVALKIDEVGEIDADPDTGMIVSAVQNDDELIVLEMTNGNDYQKLLSYDKNTGQLLGSYEEQVTEPMTGTVQKTALELMG